MTGMIKRAHAEQDDNEEWSGQLEREEGRWSSHPDAAEVPNHLSGHRHRESERWDGDVPPAAGLHLHDLQERAMPL